MIVLWKAPDCKSEVYVDDSYKKMTRAIYI